MFRKLFPSLLAVLLISTPLVATSHAAPSAHISNSGTNTVSVVDTATDTVTATIPVGVSADGLAANPAGTRVCVANPGSSIASPAPVTIGLVSLWRGENDALDAVGTNHGTWTGTAAYGTGAMGNAFSFDGGTSHVVTSDIDSETVSVSFWFKRNAMPHQCGGLVTKMMDGDLSAWAVYLNGDRIHVRTDTSDSGQQYLESSTVFSSGVWYHVAFVYDKATAKLYVNGLLDQTQAVGAILNGNDYPVTLGSGANGGNLCLEDSHFNGLMDEVSLYNRVLSVDEIRSLYDQNFDFELDPAGVAGPSISGWKYEFFTMNDSGFHGSNPTADHELTTTASRSFSGSKAVYSRIQTIGGVGNQDPDYHYATHLLTTDYLPRTGKNLDAVTVWRSDIAYTTSSRWFYWFMIEMSDGTNSHSVMLACRDWGAQEGCTNDFQDTHDQTSTGSDGQTWYRHRVPVPANLDQSRLKIAIRHTERSWDATSAESSLYYDLLGEETVVSNQIPNDDFAGATLLGTVPFLSSIDVTNATVAADDPALPSCGQPAGTKSVWYDYTPSTSRSVFLDTFGSSYDTTIGVFTGAQGSLTEVVCSDDDGRSPGGLGSAVSLDVTAGTTYHIVVYSKAVVTTAVLQFHATSFYDVPGNHMFWRYIEGFYAQGVTNGCALSPRRYCPDNTVTRAEMSVFLLRAKHGSSYQPPASGNIFADEPVTGKAWMEPWANQFYAEGITSGCAVSPLRYCPENQVNRAEMAVFVLRSTKGSTYHPPAVSGIFADVPVTGKEWMQGWIEEYYREGITSGCAVSPLRYCPENSVTRAEMAVFVSRAYALTQLP